MAITVNPPNATNTPGSQRIAGNYNNAQWISKNSSLIKPEIHKDWFDQFGKLVGFTDALRMAGRVFDVPNQTITHFEKGSRLNTLKVGVEVSATTAGDDFTLTLDADNLDTNSKHPVRVNDIIPIPGQFSESGNIENFQVVALGGSNDTELTMRPLKTAFGIGTAIPADTYLMIGHNAFGPGTGQPAGTTDSWVSYTHNATKIKETLTFEDGVQAKIYYIDKYNGNRGLYNDRVMETQFLHDVKEDVAATLGTDTDNSSLTQTSQRGGTNQVVTGKGWVTWANERAQSYTYSVAPTIEDYEEMIQILEGQGIMTGSVTQFSAPYYMRLMRQDVLEHIKDFSGGTDLYNKFEKSYGIDVTKIKIGSHVFNLVPIPSWQDPTRYGIQVNGTYSYEFPEMSVIVPDGNVTMKIDTGSGMTEKSLPNTMLGYVNKNGENERRVIGIENGMNGVINSPFVSNQYGGWSTYTMSHMLMQCAAVNQWIKITKQ